MVVVVVVVVVLVAFELGSLILFISLWLGRIVDDGTEGLIIIVSMGTGMVMGVVSCTTGRTVVVVVHDCGVDDDGGEECTRGKMWCCHQYCIRYRSNDRTIRLDTIQVVGNRSSQTMSNVCSNMVVVDDD